MRTYGGEEAEAREIKDLLDLAYAEEFHHQPATFENWSRFMFEDPMFDPGVWFLAVADGKIVGAALNWDEGYIKDLVVHPDWRGRGLGKALVYETFGEFKRRGLPRVTLKTDSNNPTDAWRLYERVGMSKERTYEIFQKGSVLALRVGADESDCQSPKEFPSGSLHWENQPIPGTGILSSPEPPESRTLATWASMSSTS